MFYLTDTVDQTSKLFDGQVLVVDRLRFVDDMRREIRLDAEFLLVLDELRQSRSSVEFAQRLLPQVESFQYPVDLVEVLGVNVLAGAFLRKLLQVSKAAPHVIESLSRKTCSVVVDQLVALLQRSLSQLATLHSTVSVTSSTSRAAAVLTDSHVADLQTVYHRTSECFSRTRQRTLSSTTDNHTRSHRLLKGRQFRLDHPCPGVVGKCSVDRIVAALCR